MKKFLSLVLALVMTMSLVTISAGAAEYKDLTDKDEIQYEEAVAVLNRIGIITGYSDGSFQPKTELTRGAAAKIIVSLLIGPDAANNLVAPAAPYSDVPVDHTFAGVISYCKTSKIIDGYSDGTFRPAGTLSGYAFSKMLLGALGYKGDIEGFTGSGWTMNVARLGNSAGLFDRLSFKGNESVNREQACQLALNTLKGTLVEYSGGFTVSAGDAQVVGAQTRTYITSNQEFATHINNRKSGNVGSAVDDHYTVEFGEEHFVDLRMTADGTTIDEFGRPSNEWSYKKVTIGTFPLTPDFTYTTQVIHCDDKTVTAAAKERALGLSAYDYESDTARDTRGERTSVYVNGKFDKYLSDVAEIADYTDNGALVEVYVDQDDADWISYVAVTQTQLMEVKRIASTYVVLDKYDGDGSDGKGYGFNYAPSDVAVRNVEEGDDCYAFLSGLKAGDMVAIVPVADDHNSKTYHVSEAYTPEKVTGALTKVETYGSTNNTDVSAVALTVGGTVYKTAQWNKDIQEIDGDKIKVTNKDVTLYMDKYGNAMLAKDVGDTSNYMVVGNYYETLVNNRIVTFVEGWDIGGDKLSLNLGTSFDKTSTGYKPGDLVRYTNDTNNANADWELGTLGIYNVSTADVTVNPVGPVVRDADIKSRDQMILLDNWGGVVPDTSAGDKTYVEKGIKFIYVTFTDSGEVDSLEFVNGMQDVSNKELRSYGSTTGAITQAGKGIYNASLYDTAQACVALKDNAVVANKGIKAVVVKSDSSSITTSDVLYIRDLTGYQEKQADGTIIYGYKAAITDKNGLVSEETTIYSDKSLKRGEFARYTAATREGYEDGTFYKLQKLDNTKLTTSALKAVISGPSNILGPNNTFVILNQGSHLVSGVDTPYTYSNWGNNGGVVATNISSVGGRELDDADSIITKDAIWVDLTGNAISSADNIKDMMEKPDADGYIYDDFAVSFVFNDNDDSDNYRKVAFIVVTDIMKSTKTVVDDESGEECTVTVKNDADSTATWSLVATDGKAVVSGAVDATAGTFKAVRGDSLALTLNKDDANDTVTFTSSNATISQVGNTVYVTPAASGAVSITVKSVAYVAPVNLKVALGGTANTNYDTLKVNGGAITASGIDVAPGSTVTVTFVQQTGTDLAENNLNTATVADAEGNTISYTVSNTAGVTETFTYDDVATTIRGMVADTTTFQPDATEAAAINASGTYYQDNDGNDTPWTAAAGTAVPATGIYTKTSDDNEAKAVVTITFTMPNAAANLTINGVSHT